MCHAVNKHKKWTVFLRHPIHTFVVTGHHWSSIASNTNHLAHRYPTFVHGDVHNSRCFSVPNCDTVQKLGHACTFLHDDGQVFLGGSVRRFVYSDANEWWLPQVLLQLWLNNFAEASYWMCWLSHMMHLPPSSETVHQSCAVLVKFQALVCICNWPLPVWWASSMF